LPPKRDETALQEDEELQLALALSQSEAEEKERLVSCGDPSRETLGFPGSAGGAPIVLKRVEVCHMLSQ
jgi:hypothetical protein